MLQFCDLITASAIRSYFTISLPIGMTFFKVICIRLLIETGCKRFVYLTYFDSWPPERTIAELFHHVSGVWLQLLEFIYKYLDILTNDPKLTNHWQHHVNCLNMYKTRMGTGFNLKASLYSSEGQLWVIDNNTTINKILKWFMWSSMRQHYM